MAGVFSTSPVPEDFGDELFHSGRGHNHIANRITNANAPPTNRIQAHWFSLIFRLPSELLPVWPIYQKWQPFSSSFHPFARRIPHCIKVFSDTLWNFENGLNELTAHRRYSNCRAGQLTPARYSLGKAEDCRIGVIACRRSFTWFCFQEKCFAVSMLHSVKNPAQTETASS